MLKHATAEILSAHTAPAGLTRTAHRADFSHHEVRPGYLYIRSRAISSRCNENFDEFPADEIAAAYKSFIGKPVFVNHVNEDHRRARGVIIGAALHLDRNPDNTPDTWVEVLMEVDGKNFPKLAEAILTGKIDRTSMGCDVEYSICSACGNKATAPAEYCIHIPAMKGRPHTAVGPITGARHTGPIREICHGLRFFENSLLVEAPADPTAHLLGVDATGLDKTARSRTAMPSNSHPRPAGFYSTDFDTRGNTVEASRQPPADPTCRSAHLHDVGDIHYLEGYDRASVIHPESVASLQYATYPCGRHVFVYGVETKPNQQRKGYASALMDDLYNRHPHAVIEHGDRTPEGRNWWSTYQDPAPHRSASSITAAFARTAMPSELHPRPEGFYSTITDPHGDIVQPGHHPVTDPHCDESSHYLHPVHPHYLEGYDPASPRHPKPVSTLEYLVNHCGKHIYVSHLGTEDGERSKGYASALMDDLYSKYPHATIDHGHRTMDGQGWWDTYDDPAPHRSIGDAERYARRTARYPATPAEGPVCPRCTHVAGTGPGCPRCDTIKTLKGAVQDLGLGSDGHDMHWQLREAGPTIHGTCRNCGRTSEVGAPGMHGDNNDAPSAHAQPCPAPPDTHRPDAAERLTRAVDYIPGPRLPRYLNTRRAARAEGLTFEYADTDTGGSKYPTHRTLSAVHPEHGTIGTLKYWPPKTPRGPLAIDRVEVHPDHRRQGVASALMDHVQRMHPASEIRHGDRTPAGGAFWDAYSADAPRAYVRRGRTSGLQTQAMPPRHEDPSKHPFFVDNPVSSANVMAHWHQATDEEKAQGMRWYSDAHLLAHAVAHTYAEGDVGKVAGVLSAYSPRSAWAANMHNAVRSFKEGRALEKGEGVSIMGVHHSAAQKIMDGEDYDTVLKGPKTNAFAKLIHHGGVDPDTGEHMPHVVIDRHALSVAAGKRMSEDDAAGFPSSTPHYYNHVAKTYQDAAKHISDTEDTPVAPHQLQAITWLTRIRLNRADDLANKGGGGKGRAKMQDNVKTRWQQDHRELLPGGAGEDNMHMARRRLGYGETKAPAQVDTLRSDGCDVCGNSEGWDGRSCPVCQYVAPPVIFRDPDTSVAREMDLRGVGDAAAQTALGQGADVVPGGLDASNLPPAGPAADEPGGPVVGGEVEDPTDATADGDVRTLADGDPTLPGTPDQDPALAGIDPADVLTCPACGYQAPAGAPVSTVTADPMAPASAGPVAGDVCPQCGQALLVSAAELQGEVPPPVDPAMDPQAAPPGAEGAEPAPGQDPAAADQPPAPEDAQDTEQPPPDGQQPDQPDDGGHPEDDQDPDGKPTPKSPAVKRVSTGAKS